MYILVIVLTVIASILLMGVVLIQKSKGGGLSSSFASSNQIMGVRRTNDFIEKTTWVLAAVVGILSILSVFVAPSITSGSRVVPTTPVSVPAQGYNTETPAQNTENAVVEGAEEVAPVEEAGAGEN